ncbi:choline transporter-like protein 3 isoform X3 [Rhinatrema bivittatum]|uniref:choline transporter-like protein 3 isoform X3 n=1 Tax=Rhinatrema bivittatum TaxID=194408 RepID=UPI001129BB69|nr:choline transporter-like protein 3 isoform X3 [Rhinatrema bivittatum]
MACWGEYRVSEHETSRQRQWRPQIYRKCTDIPWLILFFLFWSGLMFITGYAIMAGAAERLIFGYDSYGNVCGKRNPPVRGAPLSGRDMTDKKYIFFLDSCSLEIRNLKISSIALCVSGCPPKQLNTLEEVQTFAKDSGSYLCVYNLNYTDYTKSAELCPRLPVPPSKSFPLFNRCVPQNPDCYSSFASVLINVVNEVDLFHRILSGIMAGKDSVIGLSVFAVVLLILMCILRKRIQLTIQLFRVASKIISQVPFLLFQPLWTFIILIFFWVFWVAVLLSLGTAGSSQVVAEGRVEYKSLSGIRYMWWYHLAGLIWTSEFILACQQMVIAGAVVSLYFNRDKNNPPSHPILSSVSILFCYHQGTVIKGSFLISLTRIPRIIFMYLHNLLKGKGNGCARYLSKCCFCCLCCFEKCLCYLTQNAYAATVINGTSFCISAKEAFIILSRNSLNVASLNCFGDFLIFLGKVFVVCFTVFGGLMAFNYHRELHVWVVPLLLVAFFAYLVAHSFLSVFEMVIDVLFLCYAIDMETNDGSSEKPYFMDQDLMNLLDKTNKETEKIREREKSPQKHEDGTELQPMVRSE